MYINETVTERKTVKLPIKLTSFNVTVFFIFLAVISVGVIKYNAYRTEITQTLVIVSEPKIDDIYFLDFRLLSDDLRPKEKYRIAKVVDITGNITTLLYGSFYYEHKHAAINAIKYGQLSYKDYFEPKRYNLPHNSIKSMHQNQAIYLAKRPVRKTLFNNLVGPDIYIPPTSNLTFGKKENIKGEAFLNNRYSETNLKTAFEYFQASAKLGYAKGQVNLAEMYINGQHTDKDFVQALYWLKQASLQSSKPAILKYAIVCKQVELCNLVNFYDELINSGVNIKVRKIDFELGAVDK